MPAARLIWTCTWASLKQLGWVLFSSDLELLLEQRKDCTTCSEATLVSIKSLCFPPCPYSSPSRLDLPCFLQLMHRWQFKSYYTHRLYGNQQTALGNWSRLRAHQKTINQISHLRTFVPCFNICTIFHSSTPSPDKQSTNKCLSCCRVEMLISPKVQWC